MNKHDLFPMIPETAYIQLNTFFFFNSISLNSIRAINFNSLHSEHFPKQTRFYCHQDSSHRDGNIPKTSVHYIIIPCTATAGGQKPKACVIW